MLRVTVQVIEKTGFRGTGPVWSRRVTKSGPLLFPGPEKNGDVF